ncbi:MAG: GNAT family N-acetyltransferase [Treponema sp.]|jgi:ribosomal protein S18 acetylase RimI-like enzyme|nr:GNAT family N-acetyltransferase [Treponema sp.]
MKVRIMTLEDYEKVYSLWSSGPGIGLRSLDDSEAGIKSFLNRNPRTCFVAELGGELAGTILSGHDGRRAYIYHLAVGPEYRRQGIGRALAGAVEEAMRGEGINKIALVAFKTNTGGNGFWEKLGFAERKDLVYRDKSVNRENL